MLDWKLSDDYGPIDIGQCFAEHIQKTYPGVSDWMQIANEAMRENIEGDEFWTTFFHKPSKGSLAFSVTLPLGDPDAPPGFTVDVRECLLEEIKMHRPGDKDGEPIVGENGEAWRKIIADIRKLADELEAVIAGSAAERV